MGLWLSGRINMNPRFVITGGPGAGKTTLLKALAKRGYRCIPESARAIIQARKAAGLSPRPSPDQFGWDILQVDIEQYPSILGAAMPIFFDRGIVDALGMLEQRRQLSARELARLLTQYPYHPLAFIAPPWPDIFCQDDERDQTFDEALEIDRGLRQWYERWGYDLLELPMTSVAVRVDFVLSHVNLALTRGGKKPQR
jgi:predicted ATPase